MEKCLIIYSAVSMMLLTLFLYVRNYLDNTKAAKTKELNFKYFKAYQGEIPEYLAVSRQTLKNQFELPIFFYFLTSLVLIFDNITTLDIIFSWLFSVSRFLHCYVRLSSNYVPNRAKIFMVGLMILIIWWIVFLYNIKF
jgi:hypothetical protein